MRNYEKTINDLKKEFRSAKNEIDGLKLQISVLKNVCGATRNGFLTSNCFNLQEKQEIEKRFRKEHEDFENLIQENRKLKQENEVIILFSLLYQISFLSDNCKRDDRLFNRNLQIRRFNLC